MRKKPEFDRFTSGLSKRVALWIADEEATPQDMINLVRSELSRIWKYLIEKINRLQHEAKSKDQEITQLKAALRDMSEALVFYGEKRHWTIDFHDYEEEARSVFDYDDYAQTIRQDVDESRYGGKRARSTLAKHQELINQLEQQIYTR